MTGGRTAEQVQEEEMLVAELKKIEMRKRERERKQQDLQKLISAAEQNTDRSGQPLPLLLRCMCVCMQEEWGRGEEVGSWFAQDEGWHTSSQGEHGHILG